MISHGNNLDIETTNIILKKAAQELNNEYGDDKKISHDIFVNNMYLGDEVVLLSREATLLQILANSIKSILEENGEEIANWI